MKRRSRLNAGLDRLRRALRRLKPRRQSPVLRQAIEARRRGNHQAAYSLLEEALRDSPDDPTATLLFWEVAAGCGRSEAAAASLTRLIQGLASAGDVAQAADQWTALTGRLPGARTDSSTLARIIPVLAKRAQQEGQPKRRAARRARLVQALRQAVKAGNPGLTPALALRLVEQAQKIDPGSALLAARTALEAKELHPNKRAQLERIVANLEGEATPDAADPPLGKRQRGPAGAAEADEGLSKSELAALAARLPPTRSRPVIAPTAPSPGSARPSNAGRLSPAASTDQAMRGLEVVEGAPTALSDRELSVLLSGGRQLQLEYASIEALAVGQIGDPAGKPELVIDLVLNWTRRDEPQLRIVRLRSESFDARMVVIGESDPWEALRTLLAELFERSHAVPLPDPDSALALQFRTFASLADYEHEVLHTRS